jgi:hypothetical protein
MKKLLCILFTFTLVACSSAPSANSVETAIAQTQSAQPTITDTPEPPTPTITLTPLPSDTPLPTSTFTPKSTYTSRPTNTRAPTRTPTPEPILLSGSGDSVVDIDRDRIGIMHITYSGRRNFIVESYDANGEEIELLVNTIGDYEGTIFFNIRDDDDIARLSIKSSGDWTIEVLPLSMTRHENIPGTITGKGDDVVYLTGGTPDILIIDASITSRNFIIFAWGDDRDLVVNEIAPYTGTVIVSSSTMLLEIKADGDWSIEVKAR